MWCRQQSPIPTGRHGSFDFLFAMLGWYTTLLTAACTYTTDKGTIDTGDVLYPTTCDVEPYNIQCVDGREWDGDANYCFFVTNYGCESSPIGNHFLADYESFKVGEGIPDSYAVNDAIDAGRSKWNDLGIDVQILHNYADEVHPFSISTEDDVDDENHIGMTDGGSELTWEYGTAWWVADSDETGFIDCDIEIYSQYLDEDFEEFVYTHWDLTDDADKMETYAISLPTLMGHEFGHCLGFDDNGVDDSLMQIPIQDSFDARVPSRDDEAALDFIYGD